MAWFERAIGLVRRLVRFGPFWISLMLLLSGCTAGGEIFPLPDNLSNGIGPGTNVESALLGTTPSVEQPTLPPATPVASGTATVANATISPPFPGVPTPSLTPPPFQLCSPLYGWPLEKLPEVISDPYRPPPPGSDDRHQGIDLVYSQYVTGRHTIEGVVVTAILPGRVAAAVLDSFPYGNLIIIETPRSWLTEDLIERLKVPENESLYVLYAHLQAPLRAELGQTVVACYPLAYVGKSGNTDAAHLHLETRLGTAGAVFPVMSAFREGTTAEERANYVRWRISWEFRHFNPLLLLAPWAVPTPTPPRSD